MTELKGEAVELVTMLIGEDRLGVPVMQVRDVLKSPPVYATPLAPPEIAGSINLRGRIVTAVDMRARLNLPPRAEDADYMCVIVERAEDESQEINALIVDDIGDVLRVETSRYEATPPTVSREWARLTQGLFRQDDCLLLLLDIDAVLDLGDGIASAA